MEVPDNEYMKLIHSQDWKGELLEYIAMVAGILYPQLDPDSREEFCSRAIEKVVLGKQPWNPANRSIKTHLKWVLKSVVGNEFQRKEHKLRSPVPYDDDENTDDLVSIPDASPLPDEGLISKENWERIKDENTGDTEALNVLAAFELGAEKPQEVVGLTGYSIEIVRNALKRIRRREVKSQGEKK